MCANLKKVKHFFKNNLQKKLKKQKNPRNSAFYPKTKRHKNLLYPHKKTIKKHKKEKIYRFVKKNLNESDKKKPPNWVVYIKSDT